MSRTFLAPIAVVPVLFALGRAPDNRGRYFCPFHADDRPGGKPSAEVRDDPTVLSCWSCGEEASAPMLVAKITGCSLEAGLKFALDAAGQIAPKVKKQRAAPSPARLEEELKRQTTEIRWPNDIDPVRAFCEEEKRGWSPELITYAKDEWGWAGDYHGRVVQPHRDTQGRITGLRYRLATNWEKDGRKHSVFKQLYGIWRLPGVSTLGGSSKSLRNDLAGDLTHDLTFPNEVWLLEGETDTVLAGFHLEPHGIGVAGVVTAQYKPRAREVDMLAGKTVVLVFDSDPAGEGARARWANALLETSSNVVHLRLDADEDLTSTAAAGLYPWELREEFLKGLV